MFEVYNLRNKIVARVKEMALPIPKNPNSGEYDTFCYPFDINDRPVYGDTNSLSDADLLDNIIKFVRAGVNPDAEYIWDTVNELCVRNDITAKDGDDWEMVLNEITDVIKETLDSIYGDKENYRYVITSGGTTRFFYSDTVGDALIKFVEDILAPEFYKKGLVPEDCFPLFEWSCVHSPDTTRTLFIDAIFNRFGNRHYYFVVKSNDPYL